MKKIELFQTLIFDAECLPSDEEQMEQWINRHICSTCQDRLKGVCPCQPGRCLIDSDDPWIVELRENLKEILEKDPGAVLKATYLLKGAEGLIKSESPHSAIKVERKGYQVTGFSAPSKNELPEVYTEGGPATYEYNGVLEFMGRRNINLPECLKIGNFYEPETWSYILDHIKASAKNLEAIEAQLTKAQKGIVIFKEGQVTIKAREEISDNGERGYRILKVHALKWDELPRSYIECSSGPVIFLLDEEQELCIRQGIRKEDKLLHLVPQYLKVGEFYSSETMKQIMSHCKAAAQYLEDCREKEEKSWQL